MKRTRPRPNACLEAARDARRRAFELGGDGAQAIMVSHQLPIWATRRSAEGKPLWHDPRNRECTLASLTSLTFDGDDVVDVVLQRARGSAAARRRHHPRRLDPGGPQHTADNQLFDVA